VEEARTNLVVQSEDVTSASWIVGQIASRTANTSASPAGTTTADTITEDTANNRHIVYQAVTIGTAGVYTFTMFLKQGTGRYAQIQLGATAATSQGVIVDLQTGVITDTKTGASATNTGSSIVSYGNGWYRVSVSCQCAVGLVYPLFAGSNSATPTYESNNNPIYTGTSQTWFLWGAQLEAGTFATSYIPTIASTVTRSADVATITGSLFSQWYTQPQGTFVVQGSGLVGFGSAVLMATRTSGGSNLAPQLDILSATSTRAVYTDAAGTIVSTNTTTVGSTASTNKYAAAANASGAAVVANGGTIVSSAITSIPAPTLFCVGGLQSTQFLNGHIQSIQYYPVRAADFQLQALTT
jgi:hypothetical protein